MYWYNDKQFLYNYCENSNQEILLQEITYFISVLDQMAWLV